MQKLLNINKTKIIKKNNKHKTRDQNSRSFFMILKQKSYQAKNTAKRRVHFNGHTIGFCPQTQNLELHNKWNVSCESLAEEVSLEWSHYSISSPDAKAGTPDPPPKSANFSDIMISCFRLFATESSNNWTKLHLPRGRLRKDAFRTTLREKPREKQLL